MILKYTKNVAAAPPHLPTFASSQQVIPLSRPFTLDFSIEFLSKTAIPNRTIKLNKFRYHNIIQML
jgi:hypothetical protein